MDSTKIVGEKIKSLRETKEISVALLGRTLWPCRRTNRTNRE